MPGGKRRTLQPAKSASAGKQAVWRPIVRKDAEVTSKGGGLDRRKPTPLATVKPTALEPNDQNENALMEPECTPESVPARWSLTSSSSKRNRWADMLDDENADNPNHFAVATPSPRVLSRSVSVASDSSEVVLPKSVDNSPGESAADTSDLSCRRGDFGSPGAASTVCPDSCSPWSTFDEEDSQQDRSWAQPESLLTWEQFWEGAYASLLSPEFEAYAEDSEGPCLSFDAAAKVAKKAAQDHEIFLSMSASVVASLWCSAEDLLAPEEGDASSMPQDGQMMSATDQQVLEAWFGLCQQPEAIAA